jgi:hypothetical protein
MRCNNSSSYNNIIEILPDAKASFQTYTYHAHCTLKEDLATLCKWSREWLMLFYVDRSLILNLGHENKLVLHAMNWVGLQVVQEEVD